MFDHVAAPAARTNRNGVMRFTGRCLTTTSGTLSTASGANDAPMMSVTKTAAKTGRYTVQAVNSRGIACGGFKSFQDFSVGVISATADAALTTAKGLAWFIRNEDAQGGTFQIQFCKGDGNTDVYADAELEDAASFTFGVTAKRTSTV